MVAGAYQGHFNLRHFPGTSRLPGTKVKLLLTHSVKALELQHLPASSGFPFLPIRLRGEMSARREQTTNGVLIPSGQLPTSWPKALFHCTHPQGLFF